jgi:acyl dehydratase
LELSWEQLVEGAEIPAREIGPIERGHLIRYAGASGDFNPNHTIDSAAQAAGFPSVFAHGMFHAGALATYLTDAVGPTRVRRYRVQFREQVWPDDVLTLTALVSARDEAKRSVDLELRCTRQTGGVALMGWATCVFDDSGRSASGDER